MWCLMVMEEWTRVRVHYDPWGLGWAESLSHGLHTLTYSTSLSQDSIEHCQCNSLSLWVAAFLLINYCLYWNMNVYLSGCDIDVIK